MVTGWDLRAARLGAQVSLCELARQIGRDKGHLSRVETGSGREVTPALVRDYERALRVVIALAPQPGPPPSVTELSSALVREELRSSPSPTRTSPSFGAVLLERVEVWAAAPEPGTTRRRRLPAGGAHTGLVATEVERIERTARALREWDNEFGGVPRRAAVVSLLAEVADELRTCSHPAGLTRRLHGVLAQLAAAAATMSWDAGHEETAQRYYLLALRAAKAAGDRAFAANVVAGMARQQYCLGHGADGLELVRLAQNVGGARLTPTVRAMLYTREAWGYAMQDRLGAFRRATSLAEDSLRGADAAAEPFWISYFGQAEFAGVVGGRLREVAHRFPAYAAEAATWLDQAVALRGGQNLRSKALDQLGFAEIRLIQGELDEAARLGHEAMDTVERTRSGRVRAKLVEFYRHTGARLSGSRVMSDLRARIRHSLSVIRTGSPMRGSS